MILTFSRDCHRDIVAVLHDGKREYQVGTIAAFIVDDPQYRSLEPKLFRYIIEKVDQENLVVAYNI